MIAIALLHPKVYYDLCIVKWIKLHAYFTFTLFGEWYAVLPTKVIEHDFLKTKVKGFNIAACKVCFCINRKKRKR